MRKKTLLAAILAAPLLLAGTGVAISHGPGGQGQGSWGMGPGMMHGMMHRMMGQGMMGPGMTNPGMMGPGMHGLMGPGYGAAPDGGVDLSVVDVRNRLERWLAMNANPRLKVGDVKKQDDNLIIADIVTREGSLVDRYRVDRRTGATRRTP